MKRLIFLLLAALSCASALAQTETVNGSASFSFNGTVVTVPVTVTIPTPAAGATGATGKTGATGATGAQGPQGIQGPPGPQGPPGGSSSSSSSSGGSSSSGASSSSSSSSGGSSSGGTAFTCPTPPSSYTYWQGIECWSGQDSVGSTVSYTDTAGKPPAGTYDVSVQFNAYGEWQPALDPYGTCAQNPCLPTGAYTQLTFMFKPTAANQNLLVGWMSASDTPDGNTVSDAALAAYCTGNTVNAWNTCTVPLSAFAFTNPTILKFWIQEHNGNNTTMYFAQTRVY